MNTMDNNFFKSIYNDDIIYHYTKASTAIDFILYNNELKFSKARNSYDPIESIKARRATISYGEDAGKIQSKEHYEDERELFTFIDNMEEQFNFVCFCKNKAGSDFASEYYWSTFKGNEELFGFSKLRMWDQYADRFSGVCIALSKEKILSLNSKKFDIIEGDVQYLTFNELSLEKVGDIQTRHLLNVGKEKYKQKLEELLKESFFYKHLDYSGETEYRIGTLFDDKKCTFEIVRGEKIFNRTMMLDISGCIKAIFVSSFANDKQKKDLLQYANNLNVEMIEMKWKHNSFEPQDYK